MACVDMHDLAGLAASDLLRRDASAEPLPLACRDPICPDNLNAESIPVTWSAAPGRIIACGDGDLDAFEPRMARHVPASATEVVALTNRLGHAPHTCADVVRGATEAVATLQQGAGAPASSPHSDVQLPPPCVQLAGRPARSSAERS